MIRAVHQAPADITPIRSAVSAQVPKVSRTLERESTDGDNPGGSNRRLQMKVDAAGAIGNGDIDGRSANRENGLGGIDAIGPRAGKNFYRRGTRRSLKIDSVNSGSDRFASRFLDAGVGHQTEGKQSKNSTSEE